MINFIKSLIPNLFGYIGFFFKGISTLFLYISFVLHKAFNTKLGVKIREVEKLRSEMQGAIHNLSQKIAQAQGSTKGQSIIPKDANPKLADIIGNDDGKN